jgi:hypothetical protein
MNKIIKINKNDKLDKDELNNKIVKFIFDNNLFNSSTEIEGFLYKTKYLAKQDIQIEINIKSAEENFDEILNDMC